MGYYAIGIGGTGAKCIEALTHLCASGMLPEENLYCLFVDPDRANGSLERAMVTLNQYKACREIDIGDRKAISIFRTDVSVANPHVWSPFMDKERPQLADFFEYSALEARNPQAAQLFDVLYSDIEKETDLSMGFRGHPSIGAAIMARTVRLGKVEPWETFRKKIAADAAAGQEAKIFLFGSIFGGTGASGSPTITRLIRNGLQAHERRYVKIGAALLLPYFTFIPSNKKKELRATSENFLMNTQMALQYYHTRQEQQNAIYLLGEADPSPVRFCIGATKQKNDAHFIELYAALAAYDFFTKEEPQGYAMVARNNREKIEWSDLPAGQSSNGIKPLFTNLTRFAFVYLDIYYKSLQHIYQHGGGYRAPWYIDFFERNKYVVGNKLEVDRKLAQSREYYESFLLWAAQIATSSKKPEVQLINHLPFAEEVSDEEVKSVKLRSDFREEEFNRLIYPTEKIKPRELSNVWERVSDSKVRDPKALGIGKFFHALYKACT